jgi:hypothetical protein
MVTTTSQKDKALRKALVQRSSDRRRRNLAVIGAVLAAATVVTGFHAAQDAIPMRTSMLTGRLWLDELLEGHPTHHQLRTTDSGLTHFLCQRCCQRICA